MRSPLYGSLLGQIMYNCRKMSNSRPEFHQIMQPVNGVLKNAYNRIKKDNSLNKIRLRELSLGTDYSTARTRVYTVQSATKLETDIFKRIPHHIHIWDRLKKYIGSEHQCNQARRPKASIHNSMKLWNFRWKVSWDTAEMENSRKRSVCNRPNISKDRAPVVKIAAGSYISGSWEFVFVNAPLTLCLNSPRHVISEVQRSAIHLQHFEFIINHIESQQRLRWHSHKTS